MLFTNPDFSAYMEQLAGSSQGGHIATRQYAPGAMLLRQGENIHHVYIIREGITKCYMREENGKDFIFEFLGQGEVTGELEVIRKAACLCTIEAITPVSAWAIPRDLFSSWLYKDATLNRLVMEELATRLAQTCIRASYQQIYPLEYGLLRFLVLIEQQELHLSKKDIAGYLAISVRSFNRTIKQLREKKVVATEGLQLHLSEQQLEALLRRFDD